MNNLTPNAVVCIPTFRRPAGLKKTLESLAAQAGMNHFAVVVVEKDAV
jgi:glycosyltransferase involved in cell wall biosynthesis